MAINRELTSTITAEYHSVRSVIQVSFLPLYLYSLYPTYSSVSGWLLGYVICASSRVSSCLPTFSNCIRHLNCACCDQTSQFDGRARCSLPLTQEAVHFSIPPRVYAPLLFLVGKPPSNMHSPRLSRRVGYFCFQMLYATR